MAGPGDEAGLAKGTPHGLKDLWSEVLCSGGEDPKGVLSGGLQASWFNILNGLSNHYNQF